MNIKQFLAGLLSKPIIAGLVQIATHKRIKSFLWRSSMMTIAGLVTVVANILSSGEIALPGWLVVIIGLGLGEISKYLSKNYPQSDVPPQ